MFFSEQLFLVAHTKGEQREGLIFTLDLMADENKKPGYSSEGSMAMSLLPLLKKVILTLEFIQPSWQILNRYHIMLKGDYPHYDIKQNDSAGLGMAIGIYNLARKINFSSYVTGVTGSGMIRLDGSVDNARGLACKEEASMAIPAFKKMLTTSDIKHLSQLHHILHQYDQSEEC